MCGKMLRLFALAMVMSLIGNVQAVVLRWNDSAPDSLWSTPENWLKDTSLTEEIELD
ncbi:MAG: hypothetical protein GY845_16325 [Planctomycetes bacterium]|nr:hypothetical protein [Planctomycetota bacterium]